MSVPPSKKVKAGGEKKLQTTILPSSLIVSFKSEDGSQSGSPIDLPINSSTKQLENLLNSLLSNAEGVMTFLNIFFILIYLFIQFFILHKVPYAFYVHGIEIISSLEETLENIRTNADLNKNLSWEETLNITYQPLALFRVRPVTRCAETMPGHTDAVLHVSYSPDGSRLASGGGDKAVRFWNVISSTPSHTSLGHQNHVLCTTWSPDGLTFTSADKSGVIYLWDPKTGKQKGQPLRGHTKWITYLCYEPIHMDPTCTRLASSSKDTTIKIWNTRLGTCETTISGHLDSIECIRWGGCGLLYSCSRDRTIKVWAIDGSGKNQHKLVRTLTGHAHRINTLALNTDYVIRTGSFQIKVGSKSAEVSSSKSSSENDILKQMQNIATERYKAVVGIDGEKLVSGSDDFTLYMWTPQESKTPLIRMTGHQDLVNHIAFSPDGRYIASASFDKKVKLWCGKTGNFITTFVGHVGSVYQVAWSADSTYIVSASKDSTVKLWNTKDKKKALFTLPGHEDEVYAIDWSPDGTQVASGSKDRTIKIWRN